MLNKQALKTGKQIKGEKKLDRPQFAKMRKNVWILTFIFLFATTCATLPEKWAEMKIDEVLEKCKQEYLDQQPPTSRWYNLKTQERNKKKKEYEEYKKKQLDLYRALYGFKKTYLETIDAGGFCKASDCQALEKLRAQIIEVCPSSGGYLPVGKIK